MTKKELKEIELRALDATRGEWFWDGEELRHRDTVEKIFSGAILFAEDDMGRECPIECNEADREFIAHARTDIPALADEVRKLRGLVEELLSEFYNQNLDEDLQRRAEEALK